jgi:Homeodomain-like domain
MSDSIPPKDRFSSEDVSERDSEEISRRRQALFDRLLGRSKIPPEVINAARELWEDNSTDLFADKERFPRPEDMPNDIPPEVQVFLSFNHKDRHLLTRLVLEFYQSRRRWESGFRRRTELLAFHLRNEFRTLRRLRNAAREGQTSKSPVRGEGRIPASFIKRVAVDLVNACKQYKVPIGHQLANLICELLEVDIAQRGIKKSPQRQRAAEMLAHGGLTLRKVARAVNVNVGTVSRWRKEEEFKLEVERLRQAIKSSIPE